MFWRRTLGSIIGPSWFDIYIIPLDHHKEITCHNQADDIQIYIALWVSNYKLKYVFLHWTNQWLDVNKMTRHLHII